ncbi:MAG TPA: ATP-binding protein, partial [Myxococcota bacterium]
ITENFKFLRDNIAEIASGACTDREFLEEELPRVVAEGLSCAERIASVVRATKEFASPDLVHKVSVDLKSAISSTLSIARKEYGDVAELQVELGEMPSVVCHPAGVNQVVAGLLKNAARAVGEAHYDLGGKGRIAVFAREDGDDALIEIHDDGGGIPAALHPRVFTPFFTTKVEEGCGQGLALAHAIIVEQHGGTIDFESEPGRTVFRVRLPLRAPSRMAA